MSVDKRAENRINATLLPNPGPYLARIVNNVDTMKQGALEVELLRPIGNTREHGPQLFVVRYLSPFYGVTPLDVTGTDKNEFNDTQKSYGFWAVPPDVGVTVMVIFVDSDPGQGFWIGCVQDALMNHMIPAIASTDAFRDKARNNNDIEWLDVEDTKKLYGQETKYLPVGEINRRIFKEGQETPNPDVEANEKPVHPLAERLLAQGLINDNARGHTSSSARRESPSNVYGWSTPGPIDKRKGAKLGKIGKLNDKIDKFVSRMGGHCFVMDDGNDRFLRKTRPWEGPPIYIDVENPNPGEEGEGLVDWPADEQIRIRTRKGAQILLHSSEDLIYITNSRGTAWMEFTSEGKILMYAADGIEQTSGGDISATARRDMNFDVGRNKKVKVAANYTTESEGTRTERAEGSMFVFARNDMSFQGSDIYHEASFSHEMKAQSVAMTGSSYEWNVGGSLLIDCSSNNFEVRANNIALTGTNDFHLHADEDMRVTGANIDLLAKGGDLRATSAASTFIGAGGLFAVESASNASINTSAQLNLTSVNFTSIRSGEGIKMQGATGKISIAGKIFQKAGEIHLNGDDPPAPDVAYNDIDKAKEALPAQPATGAAGAATAGGGMEYAQLLKANYTYPNDQGGGLSKMALGPQPASVKENESPATWHQANTDGDNPLVIRGGRNFTVKTASDFDNVPGELGGGACAGKGRVYYASIRTGSGRIPNLGKSRTAEPKNKMNIPPFPKDWTKDQGFLGKVGKVAGSLGISRNELLAIMAIETKRTFSPSINEVGTATGLIQFLEKSAQALGTSTKKLKMMTREEQMDWVEKYFQKNYKGNTKGIGGAYLAVIAPNKRVNSDDDEIYERGSTEYSHNAQWRDSRTGKITLKSLNERLKLEKEWVDSALGSGQDTSGQQGSGSGGALPGFAGSGNYQADPRSLGTNVPYPGNRR